ncbi:MAG: DUF5011 domain-containing protein [Candidatus Pacebacteria bacterium]|nr:DUF5011 domain-containing protein [Candidatus Paceibacterota bacterium]
MRKEYHASHILVFLFLFSAIALRAYAADVAFVEYVNNPVFTRSSSGFDSGYVLNPQVLKVGNEFRLYYGGSVGNEVQVGLVSSLDGIHWTRSPQNPVFRCGENIASSCTTGGVWSAFRVVPEAVMYEDAVYKMWYLGNNQNLGAVSHLGYATSSDGVIWNAYGSNPIFPSESIPSLQFLGVIHHDGLYYLYYKGGDEAVFSWVSTSTDGMHWSEHAENKIIPYGLESVHDLGGRIIARDGSYIGESMDGINFKLNVVSSGYGDESPQTAMFYNDGVVHAWYIKVLQGYGTALMYATATSDVLPRVTNTSPTILLVGENPLTVSVGGVYVEAGATASDVEDGDLTASVVVDASAIDTNVVGTYTVQYSVTDSGGLATSTTRTVIVEAGVGGVSNVLFLPGIMASRLYTEEDGDENKRWESIFSSDIQALALNAQGSSVHTTVYTRDVIDKIRPVTGLWSFGEAYDGWIKYLDVLVGDGTLKAWKAVPYDWRFATDELFLRGVDVGGGKISYVAPHPSTLPVAEGDGVPYMLEVLDELAQSSPTGKVTIVAHSNGGLVAKNLLRYLETTNNPLLAKIDLLVLVASPQTGTPKAVRELLHGIDMPGQQAVRTAVQYMPGAYGLLPSRRLVDDLLFEPVVEVDESVKDLPLMADLAGTTITTYDALHDFLIGRSGQRSSMQTIGYLHPNLLHVGVLDATQRMHDAVDGWHAPQGVRVVQVVGTGLWTPRGVRYSKGETSTGFGRTIASLRTEWLAGTEGDGTVLAQSAESGQADETYYIDMPAYNKVMDENRAHANVLSVSVAQQLLRNLLTRDDTVPQYIEKYVAVTDFPRFELRAYSPVDLHLDVGGKHTGVTDEPATDLGRYVEKEVPNSEYEEWVDVKYLIGDIEDDTEVRVAGTGDGYFSLALTLSDTGAESGMYEWTDIPVRTTSRGAMDFRAGAEPVLVYDFDGDGDVDAELRAGDTFEAWQAYEVSFAGLRTVIRDAGMTRLLEVWFLGRVTLSEQLYKKGGKGNVTAAKALLETVAWSAEKQSGKGLSVEEAETIAGLARAVRKSL